MGPAVSPMLDVPVMRICTYRLRLLSRVFLRFCVFPFETNGKCFEGSGGRLSGSVEATVLDGVTAAYGQTRACVALDADVKRDRVVEPVAARGGGNERLRG